MLQKKGREKGVKDENTEGMISRSTSYNDPLFTGGFNCYWRVESHADVTPYLCNLRNVT
jgi:hypothetical protein